MLHKSYPFLKFNPSNEGPYFKLDDLGIKIEAKSKLNRNYLGNILDPSIPLDRIICLKLLSKDVFEASRLEEAFKNSETNIAVINVSYSQFGDLFAAFAYNLDNVGFNLIEEFKEAIKIVERKNKAVLLYSEQVSLGQSYSICAIALDKTTIKNFGSRLDKLEKDYKIDTKTADGYYRLIDEARKLN